MDIEELLLKVEELLSQSGGITYTVNTERVLGHVSSFDIRVSLR